MNLDKLYKIIENRRKYNPKRSYVSSLLNKGRDAISQKVGEESVEVVIAAQNENKKEIIKESADLLFHLLILLNYFGLKPRDLFEELEKRNKNYK